MTPPLPRRTRRTQSRSPYAIGQFTKADVIVRKSSLPCESRRAICTRVQPTGITLAPRDRDMGGRVKRATVGRWSIGFSIAWFVTLGFVAGRATYAKSKSKKAPNQDVLANAVDKVTHGRQTFRFDTFGDQAFWGDTLKLHRAIEGAALGGVGPGVSPRTALAVGLKIDLDALPSKERGQIERGAVNLDNPAVTVALLELDAVVGVKGFFAAGGTLQSVGIQCALCHSTVDDSNPGLCLGAVATNPGTGCIGHRLDGWPNRDLNVGAIVALAPDLSTVAALLGKDQNTVRTVLRSW